jgi:hypothetical protein
MSAERQSKPVAITAKASSAYRKRFRMWGLSTAQPAASGGLGRMLQLGDGAVETLQQMPHSGQT